MGAKDGQEDDEARVLSLKWELIWMKDDECDIKFVRSARTALLALDAWPADHGLI